MSVRTGFESRRRTTLISAIAVAALLATTAAGAAGDLDPSFGLRGIVRTDLGGTEFAAAVARQPDGKLVAGGETTSGSAFADFALVRYAADGALDPGFGSGGKAVSDLFPTPAGARDVEVQADGKILAAGYAANFTRFAFVRYQADGTLDPTFGIGGKTTVAAGRGAFSALLQPDGKIVAAGDAINASGSMSGFALVRLDADGSPDATFDGDGQVKTLFASFGGASSVVLQTDGKLVVAGVGDANFALARYNGDGSLDSSFGVDGTVTTNLGGFDSILALALQPDGKLVAAGITRSTGPARVAVARYESGGALDPTFGVGGVLISDLGGAPDAVVDAVSVDASGRILVAGNRQSGPVATDRDFVVARFGSSGTPDASFGTSGLVTTDLGGFDQLEDIVLEPDGKLVGAGFASGDIGLVRYLGDPATIAAAIDVRPGSDPNPIRPDGRGSVPVAILTTDELDATDIAWSTVCFGDAEAPEQRDCTEAHGSGHREDVNRDGRVDLVLHFDVAETGIDPEDSRACLTGRTTEGVKIEGCDSIVTR